MKPRPDFLLTLPILAALTGCFSEAAPETLQGYVEGVHVRVAAEIGGRIVERPVSAGDRVASGDLLFTLDSDDEREAVATAEARLAQARAQLENLTSGKRPEEIAVIAADLESARTAFNNAEEDYRRKLTLRRGEFVAQSVVDDAEARRDTAFAAAEATERQLLVAKLPARPSEISAAELNVTALEASLARAEIALAKRSVSAPVAGLVDETYFEPGEIVGNGRAIVSLLPDDGRKIRFYIPEPRLSAFAIGDEVAVGCDGCPDGLAGTVTFVAPEAEFTPPVIFSQDTRDKLVFMAEARPNDGARALKVGQPVDVSLAGPRP